MTQKKSDLIHLHHYKAFQVQQREAIRAGHEGDPDSGLTSKIINRAKLRLIGDQLKEARIGAYTIRSDEPKSRGGTGEYPSPLQYFIAAIGF